MARLFVFGRGIAFASLCQRLKSAQLDLRLPNGKMGEIVIMKHAPDKEHKFPHWEVGVAKVDALGKKQLDEGGVRNGQYIYHMANKLRIFFEAKETSQTKKTIKSGNSN